MNKENRAGEGAAQQGGSLDQRIAPGTAKAGELASEASAPKKRGALIAAAVVAVVIIVIVIAGLCTSWFGLAASHSDTAESDAVSEAPVDPAADEEAQEGEEPSAENAASDASGQEASSGQAETSASGGSQSQSAATITVSLTIDSSRAVSYGYPAGYGSRTLTLSDGASVYDALRQMGVSVGGGSGYVSSIGGLAEKACGPGSGWMYLVNGSIPSIPCGSYKLHGGESILWTYVLSYEDLY